MTDSSWLDGWMIFVADAAGESEWVGMHGMQGPHPSSLALLSRWVLSGRIWRGEIWKSPDG